MTFSFPFPFAVFGLVPKSPPSLRKLKKRKLD